MTTVIFVLAVLNLALGVLFALTLDRVASLAAPFWPGGVAGAAPSEPSATSPHTSVDYPTAVSDGQSSPSDWKAVLAEQGIATQAFLESLLWVAKLQAAALYESLVETEVGEHESDQSVAEKLESWQRQVAHWMTLVQQQKDAGLECLGDTEEMLLDQAFQMNSCIELPKDPRQCSERDASFINAAQSMRDRADGLLCRVLRQAKRLQDVPERFRVQHTGAILTRLGLEALLESWRDDAANGHRLVSAAIVDPDRFARINRAGGFAMGDLALDHFGSLLTKVLRQERGFDRVARLGGPRFLLFLADTSARNAARTVERIRQTTEAISFKSRETTMELTVSCAVTELQSEDDIDSLLHRLQNLLAFAKRAGRNRTCLGNGPSPEIVDLQPQSVLARTIDLS